MYNYLSNMIGPITAICSFLILSTYGQKIHEHMTKEEIKSVFNCDHEFIHEVDYQVVPIFHTDDAENFQRRRRSKAAVHLKAFEQNYTLYLEENDNVLLGNNTPVFIAKQNSATRSLNNEASIVYSRIQYPLPESFKFYHDMENRAALTIHTDDNSKVHVDGIVGDDVVIRPLPLRVHEEVLNKYPSYSRPSYAYKNLDPFLRSSNSYQPTHHVVMKPNIQVNSALDPIEKQWNQVININHWLNGRYNGSTNLFYTWPNSHNSQSSPNTHTQNNQQINWRPIIRPPVTWRPIIRPPVTWRPVINDPVTWRPITRPPVTWRPITRPPIVWRPTTRAPVTSRPIHSAPITDEPVRSPGIRQPITPRPPIRPSQPQTVHEDTVYPQLLVTVDYETLKTHGDIEAVSKYMAAFWNAVDLRFREIKNPNIRLNIAGLIIPKDPNGASYMEKHRGSPQVLLADQTVTEIGRYFKQQNKFPHNMFDIAVGVSHRNLGSIDKGKLTDGITGIAMFKGACGMRYGSAAALVRDKGGFNGITTAAHELAHALGAPHDGPESAKVPGGPCPWNDGYLMSYDRKTSKGMHWSKCSKIAMQGFLRSDQAKCLRNKPDAGSPYPKILPGKILSRDEQCKRSLNMVSYKAKESDCAVLWCAKYLGNTIRYTTEYRPPAEGSYCGEGAICLNAQCVKDPEDNI